MRIRKGDVVEVIAGDDLGKRGRVLSVMPRKNKAVVEGINFVYRHMKASRQDPQGGRIQREAPVAVSNLMPVCSKCNRGVRVKKFEDKKGRIARACAKCGEALEA